jgi:hypothetical protein
MTLKSLLLVLPLAIQLPAASIQLSFTPLDGLTGGDPARTRTFRASLSSLGLTSIQSITIGDGGVVAGAPGQFTGFDLDAIILSYDLCEDAACVTGLNGLQVFDYSPTGVLFRPGSQSAPANATLFGTTGTQVDFDVATLGSFDANSTIVIPGAFGFVSLGTGGQIIFNLTDPVLTEGLYLYVGEVGDNGEVAGSLSTVSDTLASEVPEPDTMALLAGGVIAISMVVRRAKRL